MSFCVGEGVACAARLAVVPGQHTVAAVDHIYISFLKAVGAISIAYGDYTVATFYDFGVTVKPVIVITIGLLGVGQGTDKLHFGEVLTKLQHRFGGKDIKAHRHTAVKGAATHFDKLINAYFKHMNKLVKLGVCINQ